MTSKRAITLFAGFAVFAGAVIALRNPTEFGRVDCVIQPGQVVINEYSGDDLRRSQSFSENKTTKWTKGKLKPETRLTGWDYHVNFRNWSRGDDQDISISDSSSATLFWGKLSWECITALDAVRNEAPENI